MTDTPRTADDADLSGRTLGDFKLLRRLGRGAMAEVYLAEQQKLRRQVALKVLKSNLAGDASYVARFQNEAMAAASLVHANIVQIYEVGHADGVHYIAQEYVPGMNLREWLTRKGSPDAKLAVAVMRQTAAALYKAAQSGIIHRDIKPENIMLSTSGEVKVADFGLARISRDDDALHLTQVGVTMGTPLYMSPEQVEGKSLDPRSDLYSFGVTCYHMLAGAPPFQGETALAVAVQHLKTRPRRLESLRPDLPSGLCRIVHRMMEKSPADRYPSAREMLCDLRTLPITEADDEAAWTLGFDEQTALELSVTAGLQSATRQLDTLMKTQAVALRKRDAWLKRLVAAATLAFVVGAVFAGVRSWQRPSLLADATVVENPAPAANNVPRKASAEEQLAAALWPGPDSEARLKSVELYFPQGGLYVERSKQELARLYWREGRLDEALALFTEFAEMLNEQYRTFGIAGQSLVYTKRGDFAKAAELIGLLQIKNRNWWMLLDPRMQAEMRFATAANRKALAERNVVTPPQNPTKVPRQADAQAQLDLARYQLDDQARQESLESVLLYFPQDKECVEQARRELAPIYVKQQRWSEARAIFDEFAERGIEDRAGRAFGLAGQVIVAAGERRESQSVRNLEQLAPLLDALDPALAKPLALVLPPLLSKLKPGDRRVWDEWLAGQSAPTT